MLSLYYFCCGCLFKHLIEGEMRRNEALEAAIDECRKLGVEFRIEAVKTSNHVRLLIQGCKRFPSRHLSAMSGLYSPILGASCQALPVQFQEPN